MVEIFELYRGIDFRIKINYLLKNFGIVGVINIVVKFFIGSFLVFLDNDDELVFDVLMEVVEIININLKVDYIYIDEDKIDLDGFYVDIYYKLDWFLEYLELMMYVFYLIVICKLLFYELGGMREQFFGVQDYDLVLRVIRNISNIVYIFKIFYYWCKIFGFVCV